MYKEKIDKLFLLLFFIIWLILPVCACICFLALLLLRNNSFFAKHRYFFYFLFSLTFALIAFTQKSISGTDIERYYAAYSKYQYLNFFDEMKLMMLKQEIYVIFSALCMFLVSIFQNVQVISLFWVFIIYYFYFLGCENYCRYKGLAWNNKRLFVFICISIFGFILFTQVTETLKQAAAVSLFFYAFTLFLLGKKIKTFCMLILSIGVHITPLYLLPLFLYKKCNLRHVSLIALLAFLLSFGNIMEIIANLLPAVGILELYHERILHYTGDYSDFSSSLLRYDLLMVILLFMCILYYRYSNGTSNKKSAFIGGIYFCLLLSNRNMIHNYTRFVNMSHFIFAFAYIDLLLLNHPFIRKNWPLINSFLLFSFFIANLHITYYRTIGGSYLSSYMDNSIFNLLFSSVMDYLSFKSF
jgi:hypothetical protein